MTLAAEAVQKVGHDPAAIQKAIAGTTQSPVCGFKNDKNNVLGSSVTVYKYNPDGSRKLLKKYPLEYIPAARGAGCRDHHGGTGDEPPVVRHRRPSADPSS